MGRYTRAMARERRWLIEEESERYHIVFKPGLTGKEKTDVFEEFVEIRVGIIEARYTGNRAAEAAKRLQMERFLVSHADYFLSQ